MNPFLEFWKETNAFYWVGLPISFVVGYFANIISAPRSKWYLEWISSRHLRTLLRLGRNEVIVVVPHQTNSSGRRLPQVAIEDVLALRNVFEVLSELGIKHPKIRHPENLSDSDLKRNIISIGGSKRNSFTKNVLELPVNGDLLSFATSPTAVDQIEFKRGNTITYTSPSYIEPPEDQPQARSGDIAFILRRPNPKNELCSVVVLAGIRGIGTWGASDHLRKHAKKLSARVANEQGNAIKQGFLAVIAADYDNFDIVQTKVKDLSTVVEDA